ncbi:MAG: hypothetical protein LBG90_06680 [Spirochaetaceae bacterium]|jgi:hypothetical protein|nr:hypothetical protein [Spirochaetaceae bacterium]
MIKNITLTALILGVSIGCASNKGTDPIWLADHANPFLGRWEFRPISAEGTLVQFDFKADGTYACEMPELMPGFIMTGGYVVSGNKQISFLSFDEGLGAYEFKVENNNTLRVTEIIALNPLTYGNTLPFTRIADSPVLRDEVPMALSNILIGNWRWEDQSTLRFRADGSGSDGLDHAFVYTAFFDAGLQRNVLVTFDPAGVVFQARSFRTLDDDGLPLPEDTLLINDIREVFRGADGMPVPIYGEAELITRF